MPVISQLRHPALLLASGSPRRIQLLRRAGFTFKIVRPQLQERTDRFLTARELTSWNALAKGSGVANANPQAAVIAADTLVTLGGDVIGKPVDLEDAFATLQRLSGKTHQVYTSVFIAHRKRNQSILFSERSDVEFRRLGAAEIRSYLAKINPLDKAGAYAAQGPGRETIRRILGSYTNVVGLPMENTMAALARFGIRPRVPG
jgi:septum formation protein